MINNVTISCGFHLCVHSFLFTKLFRGMLGTGEVGTADLF